MKPSLSQLVSGFGNLASSAVERAITLGVSLGQSVADIAASVTQALMEPLYRALTIASDVLVSAFRGTLSSSVQASGVMNGWVWKANLGEACVACTAMDGSIHDVSEDMVSHLKCLCQQEYFSGDPPDVQSGSDWFDEQDEATQLDILGPAKFAAYQDGAISLDDLVGISQNQEYGPSMYEKSLKQVVGAKKAKHYYTSAKAA